MNKPKEAERQFSVTTFPNRFAKSKTVEYLTSEGVANRLANIKPVKSKPDCILIKLGSFGFNKSKKGCLRHDANVMAVSGCEIDYDAGLMSPEKAAAIFRASNIEALIFTSASNTKETPPLACAAAL